MLDLAIEIARGIQHDKYRLACVITNKRGHIISVGINSYTKSHPRQFYYARKTGNKNKIFLHAEMDAIIRCYQSPYAIYVARVDKNGNPRLAKPCRACMAAILDSKIKKIVYT